MRKGDFPTGDATGSKLDWGFAFLLLFLAWLPLPWGSEPEWAAATAQTWIFVLLLAAATRGFHSGALGSVRVPMVLLAAGVLYVFAQAVPLREWIGYGVHSPLAPVSGISLTPGDTLGRALQYTAYAACFVVTIICLNQPGKAVRAAYLLVGAGVFQTILGGLFLLSGFEFVPNSLRDGHWDRMTGTFVNRNQFAAHVVIAFSLAMGLLLTETAKTRERGWTSFADSRAVGLLTCMLVFAGVLLYSGSRAAILALIASAALMLATVSVSRADRSGVVRVTAVAAIIVMLALFLSGTEGVYQRLMVAGLDLGERATEWRLLMPLLYDSQPWGSGAGSFEWLFPAYRDGSLRPLLYNHAHSDVLESLIELGIVGFALTVSAILIVVVKLFVTCFKSFRIPEWGLLYGCTVAVTAFLIQSFVDANFQIPANGFYFFAVLGIGISIEFSNDRVTGRSNA